MSSRRKIIALFCGLSASYLAYLYLLKLRKIERKEQKLLKEKKFRRKKGQKAREDALRKLKEQGKDEPGTFKTKTFQPPSKKRRLNESEDETSSSDSDGSSITESDDSSLFSQSSDTESNSESDISSLSDDTFGNNDKNDDDITQDDFDENEINEALSVKPEPYDDPLATVSNINDKPSNGDEDIKPSITELEEALEVHNFNKEENTSLSNILQVVRVKEEPNTL